MTSPAQHSTAPAPATAASPCPLCQQAGGQAVWQGPHMRVVRVTQEESAAPFAAFYRLIWNAHVAEFSDLSDPERHACMAAIARVETLMRRHLAPTKINLASLGNVVPHLHWHIVARFDWDSHFPAPLWAAPQRSRNHEREAAVLALLPALDAQIAAELNRAHGLSC